MVSVVVEEHAVGSGLIVGQAQLNVENTLNSLSLEMIRLLGAALHDWATRTEVVAVVLTGAGEKAFCAGGDIQALYHAIRANHGAGKVVDDYPFKFFAEEYRLDYLIHSYPKPILTIGHGIVMGGGLGLFSASKYRVLTERSRLALPEITIGLFPDAGASWTLSKMHRHHAAFLGLTGSHLNAADALLTGMGSHVIAHDDRADWLNAFWQLPWTQGLTENEAIIEGYLAAADAPTLAASEIQQVTEFALDYDDLSATTQALFALAGTSKWIDRGLDNLRRGCPTTAGIVLEQLRRVPQMSLADSFRMELTIATHCAQNNDFLEGVRALLIEKDNKPEWAFANVDELSVEHVLSHFEMPWAIHPLADLGT